MRSIWIEVFKTGTHTSGNGITKTYTEDDLKEIAQKYNDQDAHEAPFVLGHPAADDPAHGWVKVLRVAGAKLLAFVDQINDGVVDAVKRGEYKKISIALYPDGLLRHVGLLGAAPPAVKGLAPVQFAEGEFDEFAWATDEYRMPTVGRLFSSIRDFFIEKFGLEATDKIIDKDDVARLQGAAVETFIPEEPLSPNYAEQKEEQDMEDLKKKVEALEKIIVLQGQQFTEAMTVITGIKAEGDAIKTAAIAQEAANAAQAKVAALASAKTGFAAFCDGLVSAGKILPAEKDDLVEEYADLLGIEDGMTFAEGVISPSVKMKARLEKRAAAFKPAAPFATRNKVAPIKREEVPVEFAEIKKPIDPMGMQMDKEIREYMEMNSVTYEEAAAKYAAA